MKRVSNTEDEMEKLQENLAARNDELSQLTAAIVIFTENLQLLQLQCAIQNFVPRYLTQFVKG